MQNVPYLCLKCSRSLPYFSLQEVHKPSYLLICCIGWVAPFLSRVQTPEIQSVSIEEQIISKEKVYEHILVFI